MKQRWAWLSFLAVFLQFFGASSYAGPKYELNLANGNGKVEFHAVGYPSALKIHGSGEGPKGKLAIDNGKLSGKLSFALESLDTGIKMRNNHMKTKYLEISKYPEAALELTSVTLPSPLPTGDFAEVKLPFKGNLTLHGITKPVEGTSNCSRKADEISAAAEFWISVTDYQIPVPSFAEITMAEKVQVVTTFSVPLTTLK